MYRHTKHTCKVKKNEDIKRDKIFERLMKLEEDNKELLKLKKQSTQILIENKQLKLEISKIKKSNNVINNIHNENKGTINNNIVLIGCGNEDISKIDRNDILKGIKNGFYSTVKLTDAIHFNPKYPEYHNVYISNMKDKYAMMYDGMDWTLITKDDLIDKLYEEKKMYIEQNLDEFYESLTKSQINALERWMDTDDDHDKIKEIKEKIKLLLYNKRRIPLKIKELKIMNNQDIE
jgi:regulator of replication initiation timing